MLPVLIVGSSPAPDDGGFYGRCIRGAGTVIAADGGAALCLAAGRAPDLCVGDFDSIGAELLSRLREQRVRLEQHPTRKDMTDLDLAVSAARALGAEEVVFTAAFSGRIDHTLASIGTALAAADMRARVEEPAWTGHVLDASVRPEIVLEAPSGATFSVIAARGEAVITIEGAEYPLKMAVVPALSSLGVSNRVLDGPVRVRAESGAALVILNTTDVPSSLGMAAPDR